MSQLMDNVKLLWSSSPAFQVALLIAGVAALALLIASA